MPEFGWTRLAYSLLVLSALAAIIQIGSLDAATPSPNSSGKATAAVRPVDAREPDDTMNAGGRERAAQAGRTARRDGAPDERAGSVRSGTTPARKTPPPVFRRSSPAVTGNMPRRETVRVCGNLRGFPSGSRVLFPLSKAHFGSYRDTWGAPRPQGGHEGTDLMVPTGTPEYAITDGTIVPVAGSNENGWNTLGGYAVMLEAAYSVGPVRKGDLFYYAHLRRESDLEIGDTVSAGQVLGYAGDTGQGPEATSGLFPPHLHLGWYDATGFRSDLGSGAMNPFPLLEWIEANGGALRGGSDARYCEAPQTGIPRPSTGGDRWPAPKNPGVRPDLSARSPVPSPVVRKQTHEARKRPTSPGKPDAHPPEDRSGDLGPRKTEPPRGKTSPPDPRGEKREKDRDRPTKTPPKDGPDKGAGSSDEPPEREPPPPATDANAPDEADDAETTTADSEKVPEPVGQEPVEPNAETTTAGSQGSPTSRAERRAPSRGPRR